MVRELREGVKVVWEVARRSPQIIADLGGDGRSLGGCPQICADYRRSGRIWALGGRL